MTPRLRLERPPGGAGLGLRGHNGMIVLAQFRHVGYLLATASFDGTTRLWDAASGEPLAMAPGACLSFASNDRQLALRAVGGKIGVWDVAAGAECRTLHPEMLGNRDERRDATGVSSLTSVPTAGW